MSEHAVALDKFGRFLMENLRDRCVEHFEWLASQKWRAPGLQALQADVAAIGEHERGVVQRCVVAGVDSAIHDFLFKLQERADFENDIQVIVDGKNIVPLSDGIHGELFGAEGWRSRFSKYGDAPEEA